MRSKIVLNKWFQRVPKWTPKVDQNRQKGCSGGVPKRDLKKVPSTGSDKYKKRVSFYYVLHFSKVRGLRNGCFLYHTGVDFGVKIMKTRVQYSIKQVLKIDFHITRFWGPFGDNV